MDDSSKFPSFSTFSHLPARQGAHGSASAKELRPEICMAAPYVPESPAPQAENELAADAEEARLVWMEPVEVRRRLRSVFVAYADAHSHRQNYGLPLRICPTCQNCSELIRTIKTIEF